MYVDVSFFVCVSVRENKKTTSSVKSLYTAVHVMEFSEFVRLF